MYRYFRRKCLVHRQARATIFIQTARTTANAYTFCMAEFGCVWVYANWVSFYLEYIRISVLFCRHEHICGLFCVITTISGL